MTTLRILHVLEAVEGGTGTYLRNLVAGQVTRGHAVGAVVSGRGPLAEDLRRMGAQVVGIDLRREFLAPGSDLRAMRRIGAAVRSGRWDVVHTHDSRGGVLGRPVARLCGVPVVHSAHSFAHLTQRARGRGKARYWLTWGIEWGLAPLARVVVVPSAGFGEDAVRSGVVSRGRVVVVHNGVDPVGVVAADPELARLRERGPVVGFLSRMTDVKDPLGLVEALGLLVGRVEFSGALVGDGPLLAEVAGRVQALGLGDRVVVRSFAGLGAGPALAAFDVYVLASLFEPFGIGLLEGMGAGLPVVAARVGGMPEIVLEGETGLLVEPGDPVALAGALERLLSDGGLRARMGQAGRERARGFSVAAMVEQMDRVYQRALGQAARLRPTETGAAEDVPRRARR